MQDSVPYGNYTKKTLETLIKSKMNDLSAMYFSKKMVLFIKKLTVKKLFKVNCNEL